MSVSGDGTAKVWLLTSQDGESAGGLALGATLHHPTFVYSGRFQPHATAATGPARRGGGRREAGGGGGPRAVLLLTGAADGGIRLWDGRTGVLVGSAVGHGSRVNAVVWSADGGGCYSADALGAIKFWEADWRGAGGGGGLKCIQTLKKEGGAAVDSLSLHPSKRRLLVQLRSGALIGLDTRTYHFSTRYVGHSTGEYHVRAGYSPDGRLVFSGDAKGGLHVWVEETGAVLLEGRAIGLLGPLLQVAWSPVEHLVACAAFGPGNALITLAHDSRRENSSG
jgi:WD40 repeat protein